MSRRPANERLPTNPNVQQLPLNDFVGNSNRTESDMEVSLIDEVNIPGKVVVRTIRMRFNTKGNIPFWLEMRQPVAIHIWTISYFR